MDDQLRREVQLLHERICGAFQDPKRILILYALAEQPRYVNELAEMLDQPQSTISRHLKILRDRSLVETKRDAQTIYYSLRNERVIEILDTMRALLRDILRAETDVLESAGDER